MFCLPLLTFVGNRGFSYFIYSERPNKKVRKTTIFDLTATIKGNSVDFFATVKITVCYKMKIVLRCVQ